MKTTEIKDRKDKKGNINQNINGLFSQEIKDIGNQIIAADFKVNSITSILNKHRVNNKDLVRYLFFCIGDANKTQIEEIEKKLNLAGVRVNLYEKIGGIIMGGHELILDIINDLDFITNDRKIKNFHKYLIYYSFIESIKSLGNISSLPMQFILILSLNISSLVFMLLNSLLKIPKRMSFSCFVRLKFSVEKAYNVSSLIPRSMHHLNSSFSLLTPSS